MEPVATSGFFGGLAVIGAMTVVVVGVAKVTCLVVDRTVGMCGGTPAPIGAPIESCITDTIKDASNSIKTAAQKKAEKAAKAKQARAAAKAKKAA